MDKPLEVAVAVESFAKTAKIANRFAADILSGPSPINTEEATRWIGVRKSCLERIEALLQKKAEADPKPKESLTDLAQRVGRLTDCQKTPGCVLRFGHDDTCLDATGSQIAACGAI